MPIEITISDAAKIFKKSPNWVRAGIIEGWLPIGIATRNGKEIHSIKEQGAGKGRINYYISPKRLREFIGYEIA